MNQPLSREVRVRCALEHAFETFTGRIDLWWPTSHRKLDGSRLEMEAKVGGRFYERTDGGETAVLGEVVRWEPPHRVTYSWWPGALTGPTEVDVRFTHDGDATLVSVVHAEGQSNLGEAWPIRVKKFASAWADVLPAFERFVNDSE